jgi:hypothetical protein
MNYRVGIAAYLAVFSLCSLLLSYALSNANNTITPFALLGMVWSAVFMMLLITDVE